MSKRLICLALVCSLLCGCVPQPPAPTSAPSVEAQSTLLPAILPTEPPTEPIFTSPPEDAHPGDRAYLTYLEDQVYSQLITTLDSTDYFIENVEAVYISREYLEELEFNSLPNVYFGYTLAQLNELFEGNRYIFTLGEDGQTTVAVFQEYDDTYDRALRNLAIGGGVILICVTIAVLTSGTTVCTVFAAAAKAGAIHGLTDGAIAAATTGLSTSFETNDLDATLKAAALSGSEAFKWSAISATLSKLVGETIKLKGAKSNGLSAKDSAKVQKETKAPLDFIKNLHSMDEYEVYKQAGLKMQRVNGKWAYVQDIDWHFKGDDGRTNYQRVLDGLSPLDSTGKPYELHHIGQKVDSPLAILTSDQHKSNFSILHSNTGSTLGEQPSQGADWTRQRQEFWEAMLALAGFLS